MKWGTREWFEFMFSTDPTRGDRWGHSWRGSQKLRHEAVIELVKQLLTKKTRLSMLDIGCGFGEITTEILRLNKSNYAVGIDISLNAVSKASRSHKEVNFVLGALPKLPFKSESFDVILALEIIYYLDEKNRQEAAEEIRRCLKKGGYFVFSSTTVNGEKYFTPVSALRFISSFFEVESTRFIYGDLYRRFESPLMRFIYAVELLNARVRTNSNLLRLAQKMIDTPGLGNIFKSVLLTAKKTASFLISSKKIPCICNYLTEKIYKDKGITNVIVVGRKL